MSNASAPASSWFQRFLLPGFALKAVIIGGGYATGRELAEFFLPSGPWGGLAGMLLAMLIWSVVSAVTFVFARMVGAYDYRHFFQQLLGPAASLFEFAYLLFVVLILSVFGAAAGAIGEAMFGWPTITGGLLLAAGIVAVVAFGTHMVEELFKYVSWLLYATYALFLMLCLTRFGDRIAHAFATAPPPPAGWATGGLTYASYNIIGAVVILPVLRHMTSQRDAIVAGLVAGPLAMLPAILFFLGMAAFYPEIGGVALPSDYLLTQIGIPAFHWLFQAMIFGALLESGAGAVHAINERIGNSVKRPFGPPQRALSAAVLMAICLFVADRIGLVALIAGGYRLLAWVFLATFIVPLFSIGLFKLWRRRAAPEIPQ